jgi:hypothetical protein
MFVSWFLGSRSSVRTSIAFVVFVAIGGSSANAAVR